ncbi:MAG: class I tRNA ligase family protein, partial [Patescibacteria group bacterium]
MSTPEKIEKFLSPYDPKKVEREIYARWEKSGFFNPDNLPTRKDAQAYAIALPPPNVTGVLHMGHALNATVQDILIRKKRMEGYRTLWIPGTDHAGIATQNVVEKMLKKEGVSRHDLGREMFLKKVWEWKEKYGGIILDQLKTLGASCDWSRTAFTMDEGYKKAVEEAFTHYYKKGLIYQGERVINWCARCATSLSDLE